MHSWKEFPHVRIVHADYAPPVERYLVHVRQERLFQRLHVLEEIHVFPVDIGNHPYGGAQLQERTVRLIGLGHNELTAPETRVRPKGLEPAADHDGGVESRMGHHRGDKRCSGGLSMRAGHQNRVLEPPQFGQHLGAGNHGNSLPPGRPHFGIVLLHGRGYDDHMGTVYILGLMSNEYVDTESPQAFHVGRFRKVRARDLVAKVIEHFGDPAHADAADADKMYHSVALKHYHPLPLPGLPQGPQRAGPHQGVPVHGTACAFPRGFHPRCKAHGCYRPSPGR